MSDEIDHGQVVDAWLRRSGRDLSAEQLVQLFDVALRALLARTETTLGEVTLSAIVDRVLHNAVEGHPRFASLRFEAGKGIDCQALRAQAAAMPDGELREGARFVLAELLTVLGNLTAEILTPELHAELTKITVEAPGKASLPGDTRP